MKRRPVPFRVSMMLFTLTTICSLICSCSVKERRCDCPGWLQLDMSGLDRERFPQVNVNVLSDGGFRFNELVPFGGYKSDYIIEVPREKIDVCVCTVENIQQPGVVIPLGGDCPEVYLWGDSLEYTSELRKDTVALHKSFSMLSIKMLRDDGSLPYSLIMEGDVCGFDRAGRPLSGDFKVSARPDDDGLCRVRVPRQKDASLVLKVDDSGKVARTFALGEYIASSGFDWNIPDLEDIDVTINFSLMSVSVVVGDWTTTVTFDVEI